MSGPVKIIDVFYNRQQGLIDQSKTDTSNTSLIDLRDADQVLFSNVTASNVNVTGTTTVSNASARQFRKLLIETKTTSWTIDGLSDVYLCDATLGAVTGTLPLASVSSGYSMYFKRIDGSINPVLIAAAGADTIDGDTGVEIQTQYTSINVVSDGTTWWII